MSENGTINVEEAIMLLLVQAGAARSTALNALRLAREGDFTAARKYLNDSKDSIRVAHKQQTALISEDAGTGKLQVTLVLVHAQDHLMNAILIQDLASEFIELYQRTGTGGCHA